MTDRVTALEFAFSKLVECLHTTGALDAAALATELRAPTEWASSSNEGLEALAALAADVEQIAKLETTAGFPRSESELLFQLIIQYLAVQEPPLDRQEFAEYLDDCADGMQRHGAALHQQAAVRRLSDYSRGTLDYPQWLRDVLALRPLDGHG